MIKHIAKNELKNFFFSPVAWFILLAFFIQCSFFYFESLVALAHEAEVLKKNNPEEASAMGLDATKNLLLGKGGFFSKLLETLFLFIPLLTMGLLNREISNGTMNLLMSSPVKRYQLVVGKFLGIMLFNALLLLIIALFLITTAIHVHQVEYNVLITSLIGFTLLLGLYSAIGLFFSSITKSQIIAAMITFIVLGFLTKVGKYLQEYDFIRDISYFLSIKNRVPKLLMGWFRSKDVLYFLVLIFMFLSFTWIKLDAVIAGKKKWATALKYILVAIVGLAIGCVGSLPKYTIYYDATHLDRYTITDEQQEVIKSFDKDEPLEVTFYANLLHKTYPLGDPKLINAVQELVWDEWLRFNPYIKFRYEYYYDYNPIHDHYFDIPNDSMLFKQQPTFDIHQLAYQQAFFKKINLDKFKRPEEMKKEIDLDPEGFSQVMILRYKGKQEALRYYPHDMFYKFPDLVNIAGALKRLLHDSLPNVVFTTGNLERDLYKPGRREYQTHTRAKAYRRSLINDGFGVDTLNLATQEIPPSTTTLVIADPKTALLPADIQKVESYIERGGNLMIISVPGKQTIVNPLLNLVGVEFMEGQLATNSAHFASVHIATLQDLSLFDMAPQLFAEQIKDRDSGGHMHQDEGVSFEGAVAMKIIDSSRFKMHPIFETVANNAWLQRRPLILDSAKAVYTPSAGDSAGVFTMGMRLTRMVGDKEQRIVIMNGAINENSMENVFPLPYSWLNYNEFPLYLPKKRQMDQIGVGNKEALAWRFVFLYIIPSLIFIAATVLLIRRKRK